MPIDGGEAEQIIDKASTGIAISRDGRWIASAHYEPKAILHERRARPRSDADS